ncbi:MAG: ribonuclease P [Nanoarchaeota archaeon]|nr:ribonuclease P [Nanoarchaeota archaeon]
MSRYNSKSKEQKEIAKDRIKTLFKEAEENFSLDPKLSNRYVELARKLVMKYRIRMPSEFKRRYCKHCYSYLMPSKNCRIRTKDGMLIVYCLDCKKFNKFKYKK